MTFKQPLLLILLSILVFSCKPKKDVTPKTVGIQFENSKYLDDVLTLAKEQNKLVFVDFYTDWCVPCKLMEKDVFTDKGIAAFYNDNFINYKIDGDSDSGSSLGFLYQVTMYPTLLFLDGDGNIIHRNEGAIYHTDFQNFGEEALGLKPTL